MRKLFLESVRRNIQSGNLLFVIGFGIWGLVVFDTHQELVEARGLADVTRPQSVLQNESSQPSSSLTPLPQSAPHSPQPATQQTLALNTEAVDSSAPQNIPTVEPDAVALSDWQGASFPVENFQAYTSPFGYRSSPTGGYSSEFHYGLDMAAPEGSYIRNWWTGTVVEVTDNTNCGTSVVVESGNWLHIYCHMQGHVESDSNGRFMIDREGGIQIWEGQQVQVGDRVGRVGMTGRTTGPHLHWGLKYDGNWVDPGLVLRAMYAGQQQASAPSGNLTPN